MEVKKQCMLCDKLASQSCKLCGRLVCNNHYKSSKGICSKCKEGPIA
ncbi:MAG TPA: hypothetical protein VJH65_03630 [Candidatus Nanoarchaeia archaeon]|nr:hypothetical protein [Candidatus Nanoarchaeia archaeon]